MVNLFFADKSEIKINKNEALYYLGYRGNTPSEKEDELINGVISEVEEMMSLKACYEVFPVLVKDGEADFGFTKVYSKSLSKNLEFCGKAIFFTATVGFDIDRLIQKYSVISPSKASTAQAVGAAAIEAFCDYICAYFNEKFGKLRPRFSAGYGDLPLEFQKEMFRALDCERKIGVSLTESLMMLPTKSVSAIVGIINTGEDYGHYF